jgi:hypothetical protein
MPDLSNRWKPTTPSSFSAQIGGARRTSGGGIGGIGGGSRANRLSGDSSGGAKQEIWSTLLDSVASSKVLPEKHLVVLGSLFPNEYKTLSTYTNLSCFPFAPFSCLSLS